MDKNTNKNSENQLNALLSAAEMGIWGWELSTGKVSYNDTCATILGYRSEELPQTIDTLKKMILPDDLGYVKKQIRQYLFEENLSCKIQFRMIHKSGEIIWVQNIGTITKDTLHEKPVHFIGMLHDISHSKDIERCLLENQEILKWAVSIATLGTWDWNISNNFIQYNDEYLKMLGYSRSDISGSMEDWKMMQHPEDLPHSIRLLDDYLTGKTSMYESEIRIKHHDGHYVWTRNIGKIVAYSITGSPVRMVGGYLNIDKLKHSELRLTEVLESLEHNHIFMESAVEKHNLEMVEQSKALWTINQISKKLLIGSSNENFETLVYDCLCLLGKSIHKSRVYIWKEQTNSLGKTYYTKISE